MNNKLKNIIEYAKTKKGKAVFFFGFYTIFFICLFIFIDKSSKTPQNNTDNQNNQQENVNNNVNSQGYYQTINLEKSNYTYKITIQKNLEIEILEGSKENKESINNYEYQEFVDLIEIKRIIKNAKYLSKTLYSDNTYKVNYQINNKDLGELFEKDIDNKEINNIVLITTNNSDLIGIELDFSNYFKIIESDINVYKVLISYEY